ncbi:protein of unknown function [Andreprevotia lacus DSM 23236]|jgi:hypothetical protein|uniref:DUF4393 domain-containing protein n=1 Tax=Andreprevotia lacus DSM 23236 TaxID=1121001 RepID=A0A1W1XJW8_9NEIS|nr:DUF4393 domain-containing protein [Andreprevotia lacus]SMC24280.1 protein of unknown function [Andreprevotia lacus DSM 23236]
MSSDEKLKDTVGAVTELVKAVPIYQDAVQPAAKELGKALGTVAQTINVALAPVSMLVWGYDQIRDFVASKVAEKLKHVPPEEIVSPKPNIAGPALEALRYAGFEASLSDLYANLLATSMSKNSAHYAHPSFVEIIKQLTSDEAKIIALFPFPINYPIITIKREGHNQSMPTRGTHEILSNFSLIGEFAGVEHNENTPVYIDNLCRLGLAEIPVGLEYVDSSNYTELENNKLVIDIKELIQKDPDCSFSIERKFLRITSMGRLFANACLAPKLSS